MRRRRWLLLAFGVPLAWIAGVILAELTVQYRVPTSLRPYSFSALVDDTYGIVQVRGTWVIEGDKQASPLQTSVIECHRHSLQCREATATIETPFNNTLNVELDVHEISEWTSNTITYTSEAACVKYTYTISIGAKSIVGIRAKKKPPPDQFCAALTDELRIKLVDGQQVWMEQRAAAEPWFAKLLFFWR